MVDPEGHYATLGLSPSASAEDIKVAFRRLAKQHHPDAAGTRNSDQFRRVAAAYDVLGDPESRARYDASAYDGKPQSTAEKIDPVRCSRCGKITAQPRYLIFRRVFSFVLGTISSPVQGIFCSSCANKEALKSSIISALTGWWGFPWGPIYTLRDIIRNAFGGEHPAGSEERLVWYNALAFLSQGNYAIAYALAEKSSRATDQEISSASKVLLGELAKAGFKGTPLRDPWRRPVAGVVFQLVLAAAPPLLLAGAIFAGTTQPQYATTGPYRPPPITTAPPQVTRNYTAPSASRPASPRPIAACANPPHNGDVLLGRAYLLDHGHVLEIKNGAGAHAIIKVRSASTRRVLFSFFVSDGATASLEGIPDGGYIIQYAFGAVLNRSCREFVEIEDAAEFPDTEYFHAEYTATQIVWQILTYTLYPMTSGNVTPSTLDPDAFDAP
jgi:hypothetical protein